MAHQVLYQQIEDLSAEITVLINSDQFEPISEKLSLRLSLLKQLTEQVLSLNDENKQEELRQFLLSCQEKDNQQMEILTHERTKVLADSQKQSKIKQAVNAYQQFSAK